MIHTDFKRINADRIRKNLLLISVNLLLLLLVPTIVSAQTPDSFSMSGEHPIKKPEIKVTAEVPAYWWLELTGWTSPYAHVELSMTRELTRITTAYQNGKFVFNIALPRTLAPFCLIATDIQGTTSYPLCISQPGPESNILIKEVVLPPTIRLQKGSLDNGETVAAQGYTTPNSIVVPYLFDESKSQSSSKPLSQILNLKFEILNQFSILKYLNDKNISFSGHTGSNPVSMKTELLLYGFRVKPGMTDKTVSAGIRFKSVEIPISNLKGLIKDFRGWQFAPPVYGAELPKPEIKSDQYGFYQFNLPSNVSGKNRVFVGSKWQGNPSPRSTTLIFNVYGFWGKIWMLILKYLLLFIGALIAFLLSIPGIIFVEMIALIFVFTRNTRIKTQINAKR